MLNNDRFLLKHLFGNGMKKEITINGLIISIETIQENDYMSLTDKTSVSNN